uniref:Uncharacterized protein n=1 Tax=Glossina pallidipes TaxID=7398 RepID=A0A1A9ZHP8_GLOPL
MRIELNHFVYEIKKEFRRKSCGFDHTPSNDFVKSQANSKGKPYIYYLIDWRHPLNSAAYTTAILLFSCCIYCVLFVIYKLRILAYKHLNKSTFFPPTVQSSNTSIRNTYGNAAPQSPSGISMVFSQTNLAFNSASETIYKS